MNYIQATQQYNPFVQYGSLAADETTAGVLLEQRRAYFNLSVISSSICGNHARKELEELVEECSVEDWDGYGAAPINMQSAIRAEKLLQLLPNNIREPEISLDGDGQVIFEWFNEIRALSILIKPEDEIIFSDISKTKRIRGRVYFDSWINSTLKEMISTL